MLISIISMCIHNTHMCVCVYIYIYIYRCHATPATATVRTAMLTPKCARSYSSCYECGKRDSIHHHLLEAISETAKVLELRQKFLYTTPSGWWWWWWWIKSFFRRRPKEMVLLTHRAMSGPKAARRRHGLRKLINTMKIGIQIQYVISRNKE